MKPLNITFSAFGPFPRDHTIDFERLGHHGLFLIAGPTGAGKTTVLDAMVFALYGEAAGARGKHSDRLRSDFAAPETPTAVTLEFEIRGRRFHIVRTPTYFRPKQRGEGTTKETGSVTLSERDGETWKPIGTKIREVDTLVAELIGLDADQFQQVILLPQGRFAEVLQADSKERLKLLRALFGTGRFLDAVEILRQESNRRAEAVKDAGKDVDRLFEDVLVEWVDVIDHAGQDAATALGVEFDDEGTPYGPEVMDADSLAILEAQSDALVAGLAAASKAANTAYDRAKKGADEAEASAGRWDRRAELVEDQRKLAELAETDAQRAPVLDRAASANDLVPTIEKTARARAAAAAARTEADERAAQIRRTIGGGVAPDVDQVAALLDEHREVERSARTAIAEFETATGERANERRERGAAADLERNRQQLAAEVDKAKQDLSGQRTAAEQAEHAAAGIEAADAKARSAREELAAINEGLTLDRQIAEADEQATARTEAAATARAVLVDARNRHISALAGRLAAELAPGDACPTCGSTEHPRLATVPADAATAEDVERADAALTTALAAVSEVDTRKAALAATRATKPPATDLDAATARAEETRAALDAATALAARADALRGVATTTEAFIEQSTPKLVQLATDAATAQARAEAARTAAEACEARAASFAPDQSTAQQRLAATTALLTALQEYDGLLRTVATTDAAHAAGRAALDASLEAKGFADDAAAIAAAIDPDTIAAERAALDARSRKRIEVTAALAELAQQAVPDERPDPTELIEARDAAEEARDDAVDALGAATAAAKNITEARERLGRNLERMQTARAEAEIAKTVYDVASGNAAPKVALESWVCSAYLERVTRQANHHLVAMTGGQYRLEIGRTTDGRKQGGLDLDVFDLHTGATRSVDTLSGGETFMASLSLALGLAEVVAGQQNLMLDALFIDEGFGSLDAETLDRATEVLHGLQTAGRMVGVITHVTEMQRSLPTGIAVTKTEQGSTLVVEYPDA